LSYPHATPLFFLSVFFSFLYSFSPLRLCCFFLEYGPHRFLDGSFSFFFPLSPSPVRWGCWNPKYSPIGPGKSRLGPKLILYRSFSSLQFLLCFFRIDEVWCRVLDFFAFPFFSFPAPMASALGPRRNWVATFFSAPVPLFEPFPAFGRSDDFSSNAFWQLRTSPTPVPMGVFLFPPARRFRPVLQAGFELSGFFPHCWPIPSLFFDPGEFFGLVGPYFLNKFGKDFFFVSFLMATILAANSFFLGVRVHLFSLLTSSPGPVKTEGVEFFFLAGFARLLYFRFAKFEVIQTNKNWHQSASPLEPALGQPP